MTVKNRLIKYAHNCISGKEIACKKHKWACMRFLTDIEKENTEFPYYWDEKEAQAIIKWFKLLRHSKGTLAGKPIELTIWQQFHLCQLYGWRKKESGYKRFKKSFVERGKMQNHRKKLELHYMKFQHRQQKTKRFMNITRQAQKGSSQKLFLMKQN